MKKTPIKRKSKSERTKLTDKLDTVCRAIVRIRDESLCQYCGVYGEGASMHCSHVVAKGHGASWRRFDLLNLKLLCYHHHINWWHMHPTESGLWFAQKFPVRHKYLEKYRHGAVAKISMVEMQALLEERQEKLELLQSE